MTDLVRVTLALEAFVFGTAALLHAGFLVRGYEHWKAETAESVIALVLVAGLAGTAIAPASSRGLALAVQSFALLGTLVGLFTIAIGIGPRTVLDLAIHAVMLAILIAGLVLTTRHGSALDKAGA